MKSLSFAALVGAGVVALSLVDATPVSAQSAPQVDVYDTVDRYEAIGIDMLITGVMRGNNLPSTTYYSLGSELNKESCERALAISMTHPGRFSVEIIGANFGSGHCALARRP